MLEIDSGIFNPSRLALARRRRGITKTELAKKLKVDLRSVVGFESGEYSPAPSTVRDLESLLDFPVVFFYGSDIEQPNSDTVSFRALTKMTAKQRDAALGQGAIAIYFAEWLETRFELPTSGLPDLGYESDPEAAAEMLRHAWGLGQLPIRNMIHLLEANGVRVFSLAIDAREVDAFSMWKGNTPFVFLNGYKSSERCRFDAAHELGHLVLHKHGGPRGRQAEIEANRFASAFLMPKGSVLGYAPRSATLAELIRLKKIWVTSVAALNHRFHEVGLLSDWHYQRLCIEISKRGYRTSEPEEAARESSLVLPKLLASLWLDDGMSRSDIASALQLPLPELESFLFSFILTGIDGGRKGSKPVSAGRLGRIK